MDPAQIFRGQISGCQIFWCPIFWGPTIGVKIPRSLIFAA
jgi:hypothetical protein